jgi:hypothetical protein
MIKIDIKNHKYLKMNGIFKALSRSKTQSEALIIFISRRPDLYFEHATMAPKRPALQNSKGRDRTKQHRPYQRKVVGIIIKKREN